MSNISKTYNGSHMIVRMYQGKMLVFYTGTEQPVITYSSIVATPTTVTVNEGSTTTISVGLAEAPSTNQTVSLSVNNSNCSVSPSTLTFTPSNWSSKTVTISGVRDYSNYSNKSSIITISSTKVSSVTINVTIINVDVEVKEPEKAMVDIARVDETVTYY